MISCHNCHQEYYHSAEQGDILSCSFNATRPPVQLEWFRKLGDGYENLEMQQFSSTENSNGTFNSLATVHLLQGSSNLTQLLVCRATWPLSEWRREREILLDFSSNVSFSDVTPKIQHMEINRYAEIQCVQSTSDYVVWKRNLPNSEPELIGFHSHQMTETISDISDVKVSAEGSLIFASPRVQHEGMYVCISGDGQNEEIQMTSVEILIPPSPPYLQITGCDDSYRCVFREDSTNKLTCAVYGVRPSVTLEWIAENEDDISFFNHKLVFKERDETSDTIISVEYKVSQDILCGKEILIKCHLYGPLSKIMKAESTALVIPASCKENEVKEEHGHGGLVTAVVILSVIVIAFVGGGIMICICHKYSASVQTDTKEGRQIPNGTPVCIVEVGFGLKDSKEVSVEDNQDNQ
ncbi:hypothetical protein HOLleu_27038 [Holothuria leucospilota]|uniref:Ig-like domain-containing protein n=1 Tax=Holothuria leucospilota TaxID=206669 RepID=A0A9Q1H0J1_HOLLE|nr:hypothetical protein HOLleu_27038 [Holothuria leucospilota]